LIARLLLLLLLLQVLSSSCPLVSRWEWQSASWCLSWFLSTNAGPY